MNLLKTLSLNAFRKFKTRFNVWKISSYTKYDCDGLLSNFFQLETSNVPYGATVSGLTDKQINDLKVTQPQRIKIKWSETILEDVKRLQRLLFKPQIVIDANESVRDNEVEKIMLLSSSEILYLEEPLKI